MYTPEDLGVYDVTVQHGGVDVPGSPFNVKATPTGDASKCKIIGELNVQLFILAKLLTSQLCNLTSAKICGHY